MCLKPKNHVKVRIFSQSLLLGNVARNGLGAVRQLKSGKNQMHGKIIWE